MVFRWSFGGLSGVIFWKLVFWVVFRWSFGGWSFRMGKTGRELVMDYYEAIDSRAPVQADKVLMVLRNVFNHAIDKGWLERNQNPALNPLSK